MCAFDHYKVLRGESVNPDVDLIQYFFSDFAVKLNIFYVFDSTDP